MWNNFWENFYSHSGYATTYGSHIYHLEAQYASQQLARLSSNSNIRVLSMGIGLGQVEVEILEQGFPRDNSIFVAVDLIYPVLLKFYSESKKAKCSATILPVTSDANNLPFPDSTFDVILSFGRACAASYKTVAPEVARITKPGGLVIMDFINHRSLYDLLRRRNWKRLLTHKKLLAENEKYYHFGRTGIAEFYAQYGLRMLELSYLGSVIPMGNLFSTKNYRFLERNWPLKRIFSRALLGTFVNTKQLV